MKKIIPNFFLLFALFFAPQIQAQTVFVIQNGTGSGSSWADAAGNLKAVLDNATAGTQIWVKEGIYRPVTCTACNFNDRNQYFQIKNGVKLYGGFAGTETSIAQRNIAAHPTILSGDINQDGTLADNSFTVVFTQNVSNLTVVDGFTITGGNADQGGAGLGTPQTSGAGWFNLGSTPGANSHPNVRNCIFTGNYAWGYGGGMFNDGSFSGACNPSLTNVQFIANVARDGGGGLYNTGSFSGNSNPVLTNCQFIANKSELSDGGGMFNMGQLGTSSPILTNCLFQRDTAFNEGGGMVNFGKNGNSSPILSDCIFDKNVAQLGGAVFSDGTTAGYSTPAFYNCHFTENHSHNDGAAIYNSGYQGTCSPTILSCLFENNHSGFAGGAMFNNGNEGVSSPVIRNCRFLGNHADTYGGAMYNFGKGNLASQVPGNSSPELTNCLFYNNMALSAGAVYNLGAELGNANAMITNCTFYGNHANIGGALYCNAGETNQGVASPTVRNCILWANTAADEGNVFRIINGTPTISHSQADVADCASLYNGNGGMVNCGGGMIFNQYPLFESPASANFHLGNGSPAVDKGDNSAITETGVGIDLDSLPRIFNATVDMGVFEFGSMAGNAPVVIQNPLSQSVCEGEVVAFSLSASGQAPLDFQWYKNGMSISGASQNVLVIPAASPSDDGNYTCVVTNGAGSTTSQVAVLTVNAPALVELEIVASQTEICEGETITITANPAHGGSAPLFQWFLNGNAFGGSVESFTINQLQDGDTFTCEVNSSEVCVQNPNAVSNSLTIHVETLLTASLSIAADAMTVCEGQPVLFVATPSNGGNSPSYLWTLNGVVVGANAPTLLVDSPIDGSAVQCTMASSETCVVESLVNSNTVTLNVQENVIASVAISPSIDSTICLGQTVDFTATTSNGGSSPVYEWNLNGQPVGNGTAVFTTDLLEDQDVIVCYLTSSETCVAENPVLSNALTVSVQICEGATDKILDKSLYVQVFPNPSNGKFLLEISNTSTNFVVKVLNIQGHLALESLENHTNTPFRQELDLLGYPKGIYLLQIISGAQISVRKLVLH
ncbi:MAG: immunoglobulin domain-containing protein [Saprospiraceae bacterium]|nr:immunoglobulin domain-containing protein [Saprospiraceae bacterium]MCF8248955.1 immunoglobulin domain-containing protein [Saprospiraceae bacterium]MCF8279166.1 immunoglobulin domain-containing protein [Bacteroidales bacterium]MCF8310849.1 immunoglobulin domain-containing protein [Saprospiraceae bacterium]MCF8439563.1 immunoglobulin domain-containing protein [Saprospiraceae bacterium]